MNLENQAKKQSTKNLYHPQETKTQKITKITTTYSLQNLFVHIVAILVFIAAFLHILFPANNSDIYRARKNHNEAKNEWKKADNDLKKIIFEFNEDKIKVDQLKKELPNLISKYKGKKNSSSKLYEELSNTKRTEKILGFTTFRSFLYAISLPLCFLLVAVILLVISYTKQLEYISKSILFLSSTMMLISIFHLVWIFMPEPDLPLKIYMISLFISALCITIGVRFFLRWRITILKKKYNISRIRFLESALDLSEEILNRKKN